MQTPLQHSPFHRILLPDSSPWCDQYRIEGGYLLRFPGLADFEVASHGRTITCCPAPRTDEATLAHLLQNQVLPLAMSRQGRLVLHASASVLDGVALAFVGVSGRGKSTLAAAFAAQGHPFLTDDGLQLEQQVEQVLALPGPASLRLWDDSLEAIGPARVAATAAALQHTPKFRLLADATLRHRALACPLAGIYFLGEAEVDSTSIAPLVGQEVMLRLLQHCFLLDVEARTLLGQAFATTAALVRKVSAWQLEYPRRYDALPGVVATLREHASLQRARNQNG